MDRLSRKFEGKSYRTIEWTLREQQMPEDLIQQTLTKLREERAEAKKAKLRKHAHSKAWGELIEAVQHERQIVRSMARYKPVEPAPEREEFVASYLAALDRVYGKIVTLKREGNMPEHSHWTDYVPEKVKHAFAVAADGIPARNKAKMKQPFSRTLPFALFDRRKGRLLRKTYAELKTATDHGDETKVAKIREALARIHEMPDGADVPNTWHGMLKDETN